MEMKAKVCLSDEVYKQIKWLTLNFDKEIGAIGAGRIRKERGGEKHFYIYKLYFPKQSVSIASITITSEAMFELLKSIPKEEWGNICFYWHKHPGSSPHHSSTDEEHTFETFFSPKAKRKWFVFLQTAVSSSNDIETELRVEIRDPVRVTLLGKDVTELCYEKSPEEIKLQELIEKQNKKIEADMKKTIDRVIEKPKETHHTMLGDTIMLLNDNLNDVKVKDFKGREEQSSSSYSNKFAELGLVLNEDGRKIDIDNNGLLGYMPSVEEQVSITAFDGQVKIISGVLFLEMLYDNIGEIKKYGKLIKEFKGEVDEKVTIVLQPHKKGYKELIDYILELFLEFNRVLAIKWQNEYGIEIDNQAGTNIENTEKEQALAETEKETFYHIENNIELKNYVLNSLDKTCNVLWERSNNDLTNSYARVYDNEFTFLGSIVRGADNGTLYISGSQLTKKVKDIIKEKEGKENGYGECNIF